MYRIKNDSGLVFENQKTTADYIGIDQSTLSRILNGKQTASKVIAYCIVKTFNCDAEILDFFDRIEG